MVQSRIGTDVNYMENSKLNMNDRGHASCLYIVSILDNDYVIALGKQATNFADKGVVYYPIYLLNSKYKIKAKIGVYETEVHLAASLLDDEDDVDLTLFKEPLLFSYVDSTYLETYGTHGDDVSAKTIKKGKKEAEEEPKETKKADPEKEVDSEKEKEANPEDEDLSDSDDVFHISVPAKKNEEETAIIPKMTLDDVFEKDSILQALPTWPPETQEDAKKMRSAFKETKNVQDNWFAKRLQNRNYKVHLNEGKGDCFFATIRDSYAQLGYRTTAQKLRTILSQQVNLALFEHYQQIYKELLNEDKDLDQEIEDLVKQNKSLQKESEKTRKLENEKEIIEKALPVAKMLAIKKNQKNETGAILSEMNFMQNIGSVDELKTFVLTSEYWADHWAFMQMEVLLKTKFIVIENTDDPNQMLRCTEAHKTDFDPTYYILLAYSGGSHYELASYKEKKIFKFGEIPFDIKKLVVDKCMERSTGAFNMISDFRQFQSDLGIAPVAKDEIEVEGVVSDLYDSELVLSFHSRSDKLKKPGVVEADNIPINKRSAFAELSKYDSWRKRLDDSWVGDGKTAAHFTTKDGNRWVSVDHYLLAVPFKDSYPSVYTEYTASNPLGKKLDEARTSIGKKKDKIGNHYEIWKKVSRGVDTTEFRKEALFAKFSQNLDMKDLLKATHLAKLEHYRQGQKPFVDIALMEVRSKLST